MIRIALSEVEALAVLAAGIIFDKDDHLTPALGKVQLRVEAAMESHHGSARPPMGAKIITFKADNQTLYANMEEAQREGWL